MPLQYPEKEQLNLSDQALEDLVVVAIGGNLPGEFDSCEALLTAAVARLADAGLTVVAQSAWWRSAAWPDPSDPPFLNGVVLAKAALGPAETLAALHGLEAAFGRRRSTPNAPRPLDLDLIAYGRTVLVGQGPHVPHPRAHERLFVMGPLAQIAPTWRHPALGRTAGDLAGEASVGTDARPV